MRAGKDKPSSDIPFATQGKPKQATGKFGEKEQPGSKGQPRDERNAPGGAGRQDFNASGQSTYWRQQYQSRPYYSRDIQYEEYEPAYRYGYESYRTNPDRSWDDAQNDLKAGWEKAKDKSSLAWENAKDAVRDAWNHVSGNDGDNNTSSANNRNDINRNNPRR